MDRQKVIELAEKLDHTISGSEPSIIGWSDIGHVFDELNIEINSKPVMPKCFDNWYQMKVGEDESTYSAIESLNREITIHKIGYATILGTWISNDINNRYQRCVEAILYGYEVSDDE